MKRKILKIFKYFFISIFILLFVLVIGIILLDKFYLTPNRVKQVIESYSGIFLNGRVQVRRINSISLFKGVEVEGISVINETNLFKGKKVVYIDKAIFRYDFGSLFLGKLIIDEVELSGIRLYITISNGKNSLMTLLKPTKKEKEEKKEKKPIEYGVKSEYLPYEIGKVKVKALVRDFRVMVDGDVSANFGALDVIFLFETRGFDLALTHNLPLKDLVDKFLAMVSKFYFEVGSKKNLRVSFSSAKNLSVDMLFNYLLKAEVKKRNTNKKSSSFFRVVYANNSNNDFRAFWLNSLLDVKSNIIRLKDKEIKLYYKFRYDMHYDAYRDILVLDRLFFSFLGDRILDIRGSIKKPFDFTHTKLLFEGNKGSIDFDKIYSVLIKSVVSGIKLSGGINLVSMKLYGDLKNLNVIFAGDGKLGFDGYGANLNIDKLSFNGKIGIGLEGKGLSMLSFLDFDFYTDLAILFKNKGFSLDKRLIISFKADKKDSRSDIVMKLDANSHKFFVSLSPYGRLKNLFWDLSFMASLSNRFIFRIDKGIFSLRDFGIDLTGKIDIPKKDINLGVKVSLNPYKLLGILPKKMFKRENMKILDRNVVYDSDIKVSMKDIMKIGYSSVLSIERLFLGNIYTDVEVLYKKSGILSIRKFGIFNSEKSLFISLVGDMNLKTKKNKIDFSFKLAYPKGRTFLDEKDIKVKISGILGVNVSFDVNKIVGNIKIDRFSMIFKMPTIFVVVQNMMLDFPFEHYLVYKGKKPSIRISKANFLMSSAISKKPNFYINSILVKDLIKRINYQVKYLTASMNYKDNTLFIPKFFGSVLNGSFFIKNFILYLGNMKLSDMMLMMDASLTHISLLPLVPKRRFKELWYERDKLYVSMNSKLFVNGFDITSSNFYIDGYFNVNYIGEYFAGRILEAMRKVQKSDIITKLIQAFYVPKKFYFEIAENRIYSKIWLSPGIIGEFIRVKMPIQYPPIPLKAMINAFIKGKKKEKKKT